jgi:hypothetical protein
VEFGPEMLKKAPQGGKKWDPRGETGCERTE